MAACHTRSYRGAPGGGLVSYAIDDATGSLTEIDDIRLRFPHVAHVALDRTERYALCTSSLGGALTAVELADSGELGGVTRIETFRGRPAVPPEGEPQPPFYPGTDIPVIREGVHTQPHCAMVDAGNEFLVACDLAQNTVSLFRFDARSGVPDLVHVVRHPQPHAGPRLLAPHPDGIHFYSVDEPGVSVTAYELDARAARVRILGSVPLVPRAPDVGRRASGIAVHPSGTHLYASVRGHDHIVHVGLDDPADPRLRGAVPAGGSSARTIALSPDSRFLYAANTGSDSVTCFSLETGTGTPTPVHAPVRVPSPTHVVFRTGATPREVDHHESR
ncbi:lactonase family protein [Pseudonocardia ailaonensis]|uniref:Lactonase family protein n=1 Tax=Pseudonocardia ailaonensis TaxID=367279 RepID=A0ABN2NL13_9PSEU